LQPQQISVGLYLSVESKFSFQAPNQRWRLKQPFDLQIARVSVGTRRSATASVGILRVESLDVVCAR